MVVAIRRGHRFLVIKPSGWATPLDDNDLPQFYYIHKPGGSPTHFKYHGVDPTGPLPSSIEFPFHRQSEPDHFRTIFFGDPQPRNQDQVDYVAHDVIAELIGTDAKFGVTLGDIMFDRLELFDSSNTNIALIGIPWYNVIGNHDINMEAKVDSDSDETFMRYFGPSYYSFDYGPVHFIVLDDVEWGHREGSNRKYHGGLEPEQIEFVKNDLELVPEERLVVLMMHIPLGEIGNRAELYRLIEHRPHTLSLSGHTHWQAYQYIGKDDGWMGDEPHHRIVTVTVSGSWWKGAKDEQGIPHTTMRDGAPNGYAIVTFDGAGHTFGFKAARQPVSYQLSVYAPDEVASEALSQTEVYVNVFNGSEKSVVRMKTGNRADWITLRKVDEFDPQYVAIRNREMDKNPDDKRALPCPVPSAHLWKGALPGGLESGSHLNQVEASDAYGRVHKGQWLVRVLRQ
ncbi:calcineurin-like phosphoesterase C-terminal domain-containing protein [Opitutia bacterium ISCC 51]|nr:calcineurin-like phosphoesterase C-terminal domain-containing protein [Opitutae bacterium ISCC 51]QXD29750.1 calcineurin-like phosphoesterase C-terminal domain-containing protein [Opitutae bacterium ISCC 52]